MSNNEQIFADWQAGQLTDDECKQALAADSLWRDRLETALVLQQMAKQPCYAPIPDIDTSQFFQKQWGRRPSQFRWWPQLSVGMSALALLISLSPLQMQSHANGLTLSWGSSSPAQVEQQVATMLATYKTEQQQYLQQTLLLQQQQQNAQLVMLKDYLTETEQKARRTDMLELVEYLNQQRQADWQYWQDHAQPQQASLDFSPSAAGRRHQ